MCTGVYRSKEIYQNVWPRPVYLTESTSGRVFMCCHSWITCSSMYYVSGIRTVWRRSVSFIFTSVLHFWLLIYKVLTNFTSDLIIWFLRTAVVVKYYLRGVPRHFWACEAKLHLGPPYGVEGEWSEPKQLKGGGLKGSVRGKDWEEEGKRMRKKWREYHWDNWNFEAELMTGLSFYSRLLFPVLDYFFDSYWPQVLTYGWVFLLN